jgi:hypothetical protein
MHTTNDIVNIFDQQLQLQQQQQQQQQNGGSTPCL